jgi:hypothetical protein
MRLYFLKALFYIQPTVIVGKLRSIHLDQMLYDTD